MKTQQNSPTGIHILLGTDGQFGRQTTEKNYMGCTCLLNVYQEKTMQLSFSFLIKMFPKRC